MKLSTCCMAPVTYISVEFEGDYPCECSECGRPFEEGDCFYYSFTNDLRKLARGVSE